MKLNLPNVTLIGIDCVNAERLQQAMDVSETGIQFGASKLLTSLPLDDGRRVEIPHVGSIEAYSQFCISNLTAYVETDHALIVQYDGFVLNPTSWTDEFLNYDYVGAPWLVADWSVRDFDFPEELLGSRVVGNGGFCLRSKKFMETSARLARDGKIPEPHPEDVSLCVWHKDLLDQEGIVIAPAEVAEKFSIEGDDDEFEAQFGFHGFRWTNIDAWMDVHPEYPLLVSTYRKARAAHLARRLATATK